MTRNILCRYALAALFVPLAACGGDDDDEDDGGSGGSPASGGSSGGPTAGAGGGGGVDAGQGEAMCRVLGALCHAVDDIDGPLAECHDLGHAGDPEVCAERFESCANQCLDAADGGHGTGGGGGTGGSAGHAGAPGHGQGGAAGGHGPGSDLCDFIGSYCHDVDDGDGPLHACHELGHAGDAEACFVEAESCVTLCAAARAGAAGASGSGG